MFKRFCFLAAVAAFFVNASLQPVRADDAESKEYLVKAAFLYNFVKFIEWPDGLAVSKQHNINICIVGEDDFGSQGRQVFARASTPELSLNVIDRKTITPDCHIAFISRSEAGHLSSVLAAVKGKPVLTVSDIEDFAQNGGMIGFLTEDNKIKLEVNIRAATSAGLRVDAQLLEIALHVIRD